MCLHSLSVAGGGGGGEERGRNTAIQRLQS